MTHTRAEATHQDEYLMIYVKMHDSETLEKQGDYAGALSGFKDCYARLAKIHQQDPQWESALVIHRMQDCQVTIEKLQNMVGAGTPTPAPVAPAIPVTPTPAPQSNPPPAPVDTSSYPDDVSALKKRLASVEQELNATKVALRSSQSDVEAYRSQLQTVNQQLQALKSKQSVDDKVARLLSENKALTDKLVTAQKQLDELKAPNPKSKLALMQTQLKNLQDQFDESQAANKALQQTITTLQQNLEQAQAQIANDNQRLTALGPNNPEYATIKRENEVMRSILTRELQEQAHRDMAKRLYQEEYDNLKIKSKVLQEQLDILASPMTAPTTDEERALIASLKAPSPQLAPPPPDSGNVISAPNTATPTDTNAATATPPPSTPAPDTTASSTPSPAPTTDTNNPSATPSAPATTTTGTDTNSTASTPSSTDTNAATASTPTPDSSTNVASATPPPADTSATPPAPPATPDNSSPPSSPAPTDAAPSNPPAPTDSPTVSHLPPPTTTVTNTSITHPAGKPDPTEYSKKPSLPSDMLDVAQQAADLFKNKRYDDAAAKYQTIIDKYPESLYAWSNLGVVRFQQGDLDDALKALQQAVKLSPTDAFSYSNLGIVYYEMKQYENAIDALNAAKALDPNDAKTRNYLGCACSQKGWQEAAEKEFLKAIELDPSFGDAHFNLALVYATEKPPLVELARKEYRKAQDLGIPADPRLEKILGSQPAAKQ